MIDRTPPRCHSKQRTKKQCLECGTEFLIAPNLAPRYLACSRACSRVRRQRFMSGPGNYNWKGDSVTRVGAQTRTRKLYSYGPCVFCAQPSHDLVHLDGNVLNNDPGNVVSLCRRCLMTMDGRTEATRERNSAPTRARLERIRERARGAAA